MRTTVDLPPEIHVRAVRLAAERGQSLSATLADLVVRGLASVGEPAKISVDPLSGLPSLTLGHRVRAADVAEALDDDGPPDPAPNEMAEQVGPFYDAHRVSSLLGISEQAIHETVQTDGILAIQTSDNLWVYPAFQFTARQVRPELIPLLLVFEGHPRWSVAVWLTGSNSGLDGASPEAWLRTGGDPALVLRLARETAGRWAE